LVVSLDYRKSPQHSFPTPVYDIAAVARAVIDDETLPIDKSRIVIGGYSAGGNLGLAASTLPELKGLIKAAVTFYPPVDWSLPPNEKLERQAYRKGERDSLASTADFFDWAYVSAGQDRRDPLLSVTFAKPTDLPPWIFTVAAQYDMLSIEAKQMMTKLAEIHQPSLDQEIAFEKGRYRWLMVEGTVHGFMHHFAFKKEGAKAERREKRIEKVYDEVEQWLMSGPLA